MDAKRKAIICDLDKPDENDLWTWLQTLPHGEFSEATKEFWYIRMREAKRNAHEMKIKKMIEVDYKHMKESEKGMSIEELKKKVKEAYADYNWHGIPVDDDILELEFLLKQNQLLVEALQKIAGMGLDRPDDNPIMKIADEALSAYRLLDKKD